MADWILTPCNVACGSGIGTVNSLSGSTLQCDTWLSDDMPLNSPERPPYWNSIYGFDFDHITVVDVSFCTSHRNFIQSDHSQQTKMTSCRFSRWPISAILDFRDPVIGSLKSPCTTFYRSSIQTISLNCLVFENAFFAFLRQTDRRTNGQHRSTKPLSLSVTSTAEMPLSGSGNWVFFLVCVSWTITGQPPPTASSSAECSQDKPPLYTTLFTVQGTAATKQLKKEKKRKTTIDSTIRRTHLSDSLTTFPKL